MQICHPQAWRDCIAIRSFGSRKVLPESVLQLDGGTAVVEPFRIEDCFDDDLIFKLVCFTKATCKIAQHIRCCCFFSMADGKWVFCLQFCSNVPLGFGLIKFVSSCSQVDTKQTFSEHSVEQTMEALEMQYDLQVLQAIREVGEAAVDNHSHLIAARSPLKRHASEFWFI